MIAAENPQPCPIAIVGIGLRLPGGCNDAESYWDLLVNQKDARRPIPPERFNIDGFHQESSGAGSLSMKHGYFIDEPVDRFDAAFFSMSQAEVSRVDPQQRLLLEVMHEALENAGEVDWRGSDVAVYAGSFGQDWLQMQARDPQDGSVYGITGMDDFTLANRVSYELDLRGPSMTVKAGCSSSLIALHLACEALQRGDCTGALVGASNLLLSPEYFLALDNLGALSSEGSSNTFDAHANGYARGDAVNAIYVKRLDHALQDGNPIRAIIRSTAINADGKTVGLTNPSTSSQTSLIRRAYDKAGITNPGETPVVECHGTGTGAGDPLEVAAIVDVFGNNADETYIGSVKPNIGHGEGAAGLSSLIKAVLSLEKATIPPNIKFHVPNPKIPFAEANLIVPTQPIPWPQGRAQRISINSFGLGGANAHVILESASSVSPGLSDGAIPTLTGTASKLLSVTTSPQRLLPFSGHSETSLSKVLANYQSFAESGDVSIPDLAYTLGAKRTHHKVRSFCVTDGTSFQTAPVVRSSDSKGLLFIFTGQGAQWPGMGRELIRDYPSFREDIRQMDQWLTETLHPPPWRMEELLINEGAIQNAEYSQPICTAVQIGLVNLLQIWNITPSGVVGHSSGEIAAAYAAGALEMKDAFLIAFYRGFTSTQQRRPGAMAAIGLGRQEVEGLLSIGAVAACENSPSNVTISGDYAAVEDTLDRVRQHHPEVLARMLKVDKAYHSDHMKSVGVVYEALISGITPLPGSLAIPFFSSVTGQVITDPAQLGASYWRSNMELPVLFLSAVNSALDNGKQEFGQALEVGPHGALGGPFRQICKALGKTVVYNSCLSRGSDSTVSILTATGQLYCQGILPDFAAMNPGGVTMHNLPVYSWNHDASYWNESRISREFRTRSFPEHELLGARIIGGNDLEPSWRKLFSLKEVPWLADHVVANDVVFPAAGYIAMAGEAIRQVTGSEAFTIRSLSIGSAMPLQNKESTEMITRLQPGRLTDNQDSTWFEFSIMSFNDTNKWTRHCVGEIHGGNAMLASQDETPLSPSTIKGTRDISVAKWYKAAKEAGLEYGPAFQRMQHLRYNIHPSSVSAALLQDSASKIHPTTIDQLLQCCIFGSSGGHLRQINKLTLPVHIDEIYIGIGESSFQELHCETHTDSTNSSILKSHGNIWASDGSIALQAKGINFRLLNSASATVRNDALQELGLLEWRPDIDLADVQSLVYQTTDLSACLELVERLNILCVLETTRILKPHGLSKHHHFNRFKEWNEEYINGIQQHGSKVVRDTDKFFEMTSEECRAAIKQLTAEAIETPAKDIALAVTRIFEDVENIFIGAAEPLAVLLKDNLLMEIYNFFNMLNHRDFFQLLGHSNKKLRIVEIGAGTGGFTSTIVPSLTHPDTGECLFSNYTYTDISSGFFKAAKERFGEYPNIEYTVLDISEDPAPQGLELGSYDLVVAANVLHATPDLLQTMKNCRSLLRPGGRLFLLELCSEAKWVNYIMGTLSGWWLGELDGRRNEPYIQASHWDNILQNAGFEKVTATMDQRAPYQLDNIITARAKEESDAPTPLKSVSLLVKDPFTAQENAIVKDLITSFQSECYEVSLCSLGDLPVAPVDVVSLLDIEDASLTFFQQLTDTDLKALIRLITHLHGQKILWLTGPAQISAKNPYSAMVLGFARTARLELGASFATMELEVSDPAFKSSVVQVFAKVLKHGSESIADCEFALVNGVVNVPRYITRTIEQVSPPPAEDEITHRLFFEKPGLLSSLQWQSVAGALRAPLEGADMEVTVRAASVSHRDTQLDGGAGHSNSGLGLECAGIISHINSGVEGFQKGDRVLCWAPGSLATKIRVSTRSCIKIPDGLSFDEAITLPTAYGTAIRGLIELGSLAAGETVLVHSAADAIGIAAIQVAKMKGAEVFVTAATKEEREFLAAELGIAENRIFSSQDSKSFVSGVMQSTQSRGVDIVLNSLEGELLHSSWTCVAEGGTLIDLSGRDAASHGKLDMAMFTGNRGFQGLDISALITQRPSVARQLLESSIKLYSDGLVKPIQPITRFGHHDIKQAFQQFQGTRRPIGAVCIEFPEDLTLLPSIPSTSDVRFRQDRSYVLIGGLGGLGKCAAVWLAERGAGSIIFMSRSASPIGESESQLVQELNALGSQVQIITGDVADEAAVKSLVANAAKPVAGVLHLALVLKDEALLDMTVESWQGATEAKVQGTWNLHNALHDQQEPVDFFVLLSSIYGIQGNPKQANYAAASTFLDAFVQFRQQQGLPASVIDLGVMEDIGFVSQHTSILENLRRAGAQLIRETDFLGALQLSIQTSSTPTPALPTTTSAYINRAQFVVGLGQHPPDARGLGLKVDSTNAQSGEAGPAAGGKEKEGGGDELQRFMREAMRDPTGFLMTDEAGVAMFLAAQVAQCLKTLLIFSDSSELDLERGLAELGIDSLIAIELQSWWVQNLASHVTILELTKSASVLELGKLARSRILEGIHGQNGQVQTAA